MSFRFAAPEFSQFFSVDSAKAIKALEYGWLNAINYCAPAATGGFGNLCPRATPGCMALCLGEHSGQAAMVSLRTGTNAVRESRKRKAKYFFQNLNGFMCEAAAHIARKYRKATRENMLLCVRMNGSTDSPYERIRFFVSREMLEALANIMFADNAEMHAWYLSGQEGYHTIYSLFPHIQFTDYTKIAKRFDSALPANLDLTFSRSESNEAECFDLLRRGVNVAVVFHKALPASWRGFEVIDGDKHDLRHLDKKGGVVVGLLPKGNKAKKDRSGFVVRWLEAPAQSCPRATPMCNPMSLAA
jgi:hypothetical protein